MNPSIYLDYNATSPMRPCVREAMLAVMDVPLNPSSVHRFGAEAKRLLDRSRRRLADMLSIFPHEIIFTASGTEANTLALTGFPGRSLITSSAEHASVAETASRLGAAQLPVDESGLISPAQLDMMLRSVNRPALVSVLYANNETGVIQPLKELADVAHAHGALLHADAVQAFGKLPLDMGLLGADMMTISAHKVGGSVGVAALLLRQDIAIQPLLRGGRQELGRRAGTESVASIVGFAALAEHINISDESARYRLWQQKLEAEIGQQHVVAYASPRLSNTSMLMMPSVSSEVQLMHFDLAGFCVSAGSACASGRIEPSHVLRAMGMSDALAATAIRISTGWNTTDADISAFIHTWKDAAAKLGRHAA